VLWWGVPVLLQSAEHLLPGGLSLLLRWHRLLWQWVQRLLRGGADLLSDQLSELSTAGSELVL
jgi:hypothetical protein